VCLSSSLLMGFLMQSHFQVAAFAPPSGIVCVCVYIYIYIYILIDSYGFMWIIFQDEICFPACKYSCVMF
jgi:hypothetical protein